MYTKRKHSESPPPLELPLRTHSLYRIDLHFGTYKLGFLKRALWTVR
jgi:hypothetical protein